MRKTLKPKADDTWLSFSFTLFVMFLMRDGWTEEEAKQEARILKSINASPAFSGRKLSKAYFHITRTGATKRINRDGRQKVMFAYESACNHSSIHDYPAEGRVATL